MNNFNFSLSITNPESETFILHNHDNIYEILYFMEGDAEYIVEGAVYPLNKHDIILLRPNEMHMLKPKTNKIYERALVHLSGDFFKDLNCEQYRNIFTDHAPGTKNRIESKITKSCGLSDAFERLIKYSQVSEGQPVLTGIMLEILHLLNNTSVGGAPIKTRIHQVILYININYMDNITLSSIAENFFVSKAHLAREFRKITGHTVTSYVNEKRISSVLAACQNGVGITDAAYEAGFSDYTAFYRAFKKKYGYSPSFGLKNK